MFWSPTLREDDGGLPDEEEQPQTPGAKPGDKKEEKPKNLPDDQLNKALEVLKNRNRRDKKQGFKISEFQDL